MDRASSCWARLRKACSSAPGVTSRTEVLAVMCSDGCCDARVREEYSPASSQSAYRGFHGGQPDTGPYQQHTAIDNFLKSQVSRGSQSEHHRSWAGTPQARQAAGVAWSQCNLLFSTASRSQCSNTLYALQRAELMQSSMEMAWLSQSGGMAEVAACQTAPQVITWEHASSIYKA